jgi:GDPmannose 4,6-dehydratase
MEEESYEFMKILSIDEAKVIAQNKLVVIVTGTTGQDGSLMADYLLKNTKYEIFGGARRLSVSNHENIKHLENENRFHLINFDLTDAHSIERIISQLQPKYFINFAAQSFVKSSWDFPAQTWDTNTKGVIHILEAIRLHVPDCRFYNAGSSEEFGNVVYSPQDETHPLRPQSPYGASKAAARQLVRVYKESYNLYAIQGWLFNHEGTRRGEEFVTRKITKAIGRISKTIKLLNPKFDILELGNVDAKRDWSDAEDCVDAVWKMLNQELYNYKLIHSSRQIVINNLKEYVVSSNETHSIREFVDEAFKIAGIQGVWEFSGLQEKYRYNDGCGNDYIFVKINPNLYRPAEVNSLCGNSTLIRRELGWNPKISFKQLIEKMVLNDLK